MGKKNKRKADSLVIPNVLVSASRSTVPRVDASAAADAGADDDLGGVSNDDLLVTVRTLNRITPELLVSKPYKVLRAAIQPLVDARLKEFDPVDYVSRCTTALQTGHATDALLALQGVHARGQSVRQGTVQRWVRACDSIGDEALRVRLLHSVLRVGKVSGCASTEAHGVGEAAEVGDLDPEEADAEENAAALDDSEVELGEEAVEAAAAAAAAPGVRRQPDWCADDGKSASEVAAQREADHAEANRAMSSMLSQPPAPRRVVWREVGAERQPPNHHDLHIYACPSSAVQLADAASRREARRVDVPDVPGAFMLLDLLSPAECVQISHLAEQFGFTPDHPLSRAAPSGIGACEMLAEAPLAESIFERARPLLPPLLAGGAPVGINARWRLFRYTGEEGAVYRPHIDGSWPGSGLDARSGTYVHDAFGDRRSRLTFLMYLNDGFEGGCTTFYMPGEGGGLNAHGVRPRAGAVLCFPQGNTASLLHEGSAVTRGGVKLVIRTDVLYSLPRQRRG